MRKWMSWTGGIAVVAISFVGTLWLADIYAPHCPAGAVTELKKPFSKSSTVSFFGQAPNLTSLSDASNPSGSPVVLCEDNRPLGPAHSPHAEIGSKGAGRFSHWGDGFVFSASDNSDPNRNGREYTAVLPK